MIRTVSSQEVRDAIFSMGNDKSPGPDGTWLLFLRRLGILLRMIGPPRCAFKVDIQKRISLLIGGFCMRVRASDNFTYHHNCSNLNIINLCFADELFLFALADVNYARVIMEALDEFKNAMGLVPSLHKSSDYLCNVLNYTKLDILNVLPFEEDLEQLMRGFIWCQGEMRKDKAKVAWEAFIWYRRGDGNMVSAWFDRRCSLSSLSQLVTPQDMHSEGFDMLTKSWPSSDSMALGSDYAFGYVIRAECQARAEQQQQNYFYENLGADNEIMRTWGERREESKLRNHVDLVDLLGMADLKKGANVAGGRGYYLKGDGVFLNQALIQFGLNFLRNKGYTLLQTPFFMRKDIMAKCAQLAEFDEALYKVTGEGDDKYLIATAEQPMCAYHMDDWIHQSRLPLKYAAFSSCFRKEAGSHGRDTLGIFRLHQFEKIEQFCVTSPNGDDSWDMHEEMIKNSEEFYQMLELPYQVVNVVSGELNLAAAKKYDLEAWFPASRTYRELVSCSNCTDYQSRKLEIRYGQKKSDAEEKQYCHLLNSTLTATERTICCILENYQTEDGVEVPKVLQPYMGGQTFLPFQLPPTKETKGKPKA
nr:serine--tRNA ligase-like [Tanacetum cinerariifolium]